MADKILAKNLTIPEGSEAHFVNEAKSYDIYEIDIMLTKDITATLEIPKEAFEETDLLCQVDEYKAHGEDSILKVAGAVTKVAKHLIKELHLDEADAVSLAIKIIRTEPDDIEAEGNLGSFIEERRNL